MADGAVSMHVNRVELLRVEHGRAIYKVILTCGCSFWEHRPADAERPAVGARVNCYAQHREGATTSDAVPGEES